jgi:hypothetical protein
LHPPQKPQHPEIFLCVWLAFVLMLTAFHHPKAKTFCMQFCYKTSLGAGGSLFFLKGQCHGFFTHYWLPYSSL